jgi:hypothetical protein
LVQHLIHIGYPKAGSHFVQRWSEGHPEIEYAQRGFAGFADATDLARKSTSPRAIRLRVTSAEEISAPHPFVGSITEALQQTRPEYQEAACRYVSEVFKDPIILLLTRGFESVLLSGFSEYVRSGGDMIFFTGQPPPPEALAQAEHDWNYDYLIAIYRAAFGERLIVLPYELLRDNPKAFTRELEERLGLSPSETPMDKIYPSLSPIELRWYPRISSLIRALPVGTRLRSYMFRKYVRSVQVNRWKVAIGLLQKLFPAAPVTSALIPRETVEYFRGRADSLKAEPLYAPYAEDYLF